LKKARDFAMSLVIFSCSPKPENRSNTVAIAKAFKDGYGVDTEIYHLNKRAEWDKYRVAFDNSAEIVFAMPLFVECIPGLLMEFLETLTPKSIGANCVSPDASAEKTRIGFIVQGGFDEACQLRTCEKYLEMLPYYLGCEYAGTLLKGGMFALTIASEKRRSKILGRFREMGRIYAETGVFDKDAVTKFAAPERHSKFMRFLIFLLAPINKIAWRYLARKHGVQGRLDARPYAQ
jgi:hypothetical protein